MHRVEQRARDNNSASTQNCKAIQDGLLEARDHGDGAGVEEAQDAHPDVAAEAGRDVLARAHKLCKTSTNQSNEASTR